jgi:ubiquinone/menaquinone biosynthesis C-methylase UbiE
MKVRDSGMPSERMWSDFFNVDLILSELQINSKVNDLVEIGCGYGTFTIPAAKQISGKLYAFDIEEEMLGIVGQKLKNEYIDNVILEKRDILTQTTLLAKNSIDYVMLFNILHNESPGEFLVEAHRILKPEGKVGIIHWRSDVETPRGPHLKIRPKPEQILKWVDEQKFSLLKKPVVLEPYHFGLILSKI